ncbi:MAG: type II secretion system F family protein [Paenibacillaceae bacterium]
MVFVTFFFTVMLFVYAFYIFNKERKMKIWKRLGLDVEGSRGLSGGTMDTQNNTSALRRVAIIVFRWFKRFLTRKLPGSKEARIEMKLLQAGRPFNMSAVDYRLLQTVLFVIFPLLFGAYAYLLGMGTTGLVTLVILGVVLAAVGPHYYLRQKAKKRSRLALRELPDILDLLTVSLEAGLGFDSALSKLIAKKHGIVSSEFRRCLEEIRLGKTRREALTGVKERLDFDEIRSFISGILQAEKLGIGMVQVMRVQSEEVREQRKQRAEEAAMKAPIKMLFPLVIFIFPCIFIVLLGPVAVEFIINF